MPTEPLTDFGFESIPTHEKTDRVKSVFHSVASKYDVMNDVMSLGIHRFWKQLTLAIADIRKNHRILDLAGGTGDLAMRMSKSLDEKGHVILADINSAMLSVGRDRVLDAGLIEKITPVLCNAEALPFEENYFDLITIAFGLRNVTDKSKALKSMYRVLKPGGKLCVLEFSEPIFPLLKKGYDAYSFNVIPKLGEWIADDRASYQYLVESIRKHPNQEKLKAMILSAGFDACEVTNFSGGIVALHRGYKY